MDARQVITVPGTFDGVRQAADGFDAFAAAHGLAKGELWPFQVALDEVLSNVVRHGFSEAAEPPPIEIEIRLQGGEIELVIVDRAPAFDPLGVAAPDLQQAIEDRPIGGLGIAFVRKLMDSVEYARLGGRNRLRLRRKLLEA
jgi:serine/threonine-protein kinase RsbW